MKKQKEPIFYSFIHRDGYKGNCPEYFDKNDYEWTRKIEENWAVIREELEELLAHNHKMLPYFDKNIVSRQNSWKTIPFYAWGVKFFKNSQKAPRTVALLEEIPGMVSASFNLLEANAEIVPHYGDTNTFMRCHLGLIVPGTLPDIGFEVNGKQRSWAEGELLLFCDAHQHTAWNHTAKNRVILLFDVIRPEYLPMKHWICSRILASLFLQSTAQKLPFLRKLPLIVQYFLYQCATVSAYVVAPVRNFVAKIFS